MNVVRQYGFLSSTENHSLSVWAKHSLRFSIFLHHNPHKKQEHDVAYVIYCMSKHVFI